MPSHSIFSDFFSDVDRFFDKDIFNAPMRWRKQLEGTLPAVNIRDNEKDYAIEVAAPGMKKEDFNIDMDEGILTISSQKEEDKTEEKENFTRREYNYSSFSRSFSLPENVKADEIKAQYNNGVLCITVPKAETKEQPKKKINIE